MVTQGTRILVLLHVALLPAALAAVEDPALPPPNDDFASAQPLRTLHPRAATWEQTTWAATDERDEPAACGAAATVWFALRPLDGAAGLLRVETLGSDYDTVLAVYRGPDLARLKTVACNDDAAPGVAQSSLAFLALPGETYHVQVGGALYAAGHLRLAVRDAALPLS